MIIKAYSLDQLAKEFSNLFEQKFSRMDRQGYFTANDLIIEENNNELPLQSKCYAYIREIIRRGQTSQFETIVDPLGFKIYFSCIGGDLDLKIFDVGTISDFLKSNIVDPNLQRLPQDIQEVFQKNRKIPGTYSI